MELYYCEDLSLAEISSPLGITRQAVRDIIKRAENILLNYEKKLGFAERLEKMRECFGKINETAQLVENENIRNIITEEINNGIDLL